MRGFHLFGLRYSRRRATLQRNAAAYSPTEAPTSVSDAFARARASLSSGYSAGCTVDSFRCVDRHRSEGSLSHRFRLAGLCCGSKELGCRSSLDLFVRSRRRAYLCILIARSEGTKRLPRALQRTAAPSRRVSGRAVRGRS